MTGRLRREALIADAAPAGAASPSFGELVQTSLRIGLLSFGGPAGQIALMHRVFVDEKKWLDDKRFLHALNFCMLLPGPEAMQLATYCGWLLHGIRGGLVAGALFVLPGFLVLVALSAAYGWYGETPIASGLLFGLKAAVLAIVIEALSRVSKRALKGPASWLTAFLAFVALAILHLPFPLVIALAGLAGFVFHASFAGGQAGGDVLKAEARAVRPWRHLAGVGVAAILLWALPLGALLLTLGRNHVYADEALFFSKAAVVTFGGAYAVLAYVGQQAVEIHAWLTGPEMLTGLGLAETTPGPLILVLVFVGYLGAFRAGTGLDPFVSGLIGALIVLWMTFVPCFLWIFAGAPFIERLRGNAALASSLAAITAAVVGVIANLAIWFGLQVMFAEVGQGNLGPLHWPSPLWASFDWRAALIFAASGIWLWRHGPLIPMLGLAAAAGLGLRAI